MLFGCLFFVTIYSSGQSTDADKQMTPEEQALKRTEKMKTELGLSESQEQEIYQINLAHLIEMNKLREEHKVLKEKMKTEKEATRKKIKSVLTPEQNAIFEQKEEERKKKVEEKRQNHEK